MTYGQGQAVMVLVGERMGFNMLNTDHAKRALAGHKVHPMFYASMEREAVQLHNQLRTQPDLLQQANSICDAVIAGYSLN